LFSIWTLSGVALLYLVVLFAVAVYGNKSHTSNKQRPIVYSLALGIHCTSWAFYGTVAQSATFGWAFVPTYLGSIALFLFAFPLLLKIARITQVNNLSSIADLISLRFGQSYVIAGVVTLICFVGIIPYTALQLDAITRSVDILLVESGSWAGSTTLYVALAMLAFTLLFGTNSVGLADKHPGLIFAVAFQSIVKLVAFVIIGLFVCYWIFDGVFDLIAKTYSTTPKTRQGHESGHWIYMSHMLLGFAAMLCLPRQFQINFVENNGEQELRKARWLFPLYLVGMNIFVLPIALAGEHLFVEQSISADTYMLMLPMMEGSTSVTLIGFIGGLAAASSMVIVATLAVGIMLANNLVTPLWLKIQIRAFSEHSLSSSTLLLVRRLTIVIVIALSYLYSVYVSQYSPLVNSGIVAMSLMAQFLPTLTLGLLWQRGNKVSFFIGLTVGVSIWSLMVLWPSLSASSTSPSDFNMAMGVFFSLVANFSAYSVAALLTSKSTKSLLSDTPYQQQGWAIRFEHLEALSKRTLSPDKHLQLFPTQASQVLNDYATDKTVNQVELALTNQVGRSSAQILLNVIAETQPSEMHQLVDLVEEANQNYQFNQELLQSSIQHIEQGISVVDRELKLLAWNQRYIELFDFPEGLINAGVSLTTLLKFNAERGYFGDNVDIEKEVNKRVEHIRNGSRYRYRRTGKDNRVIELQGNPMPGGGFVTTYADITEYIEAQQQLEDAKNTLEHRVVERTQKIQQVNEQLHEAKLEADKANESKTKFLAAAGHDLMQPFNAASLFAAMLEQKTQNTELSQTSKGLVQSLQSAEDLLSSLLDMTKLETGLLSAKMTAFNLREVTDPLIQEFSILAKDKGLQLDYIPANVTILSDSKLLKRILQNLISNAIRYTKQGRLLLGCRRTKGRVLIQVIDTGPGIPKDQQALIFEEFMQLEQSAQEQGQGLGLGLTIVDKISRLLEHPVSLKSVPHKGTSFTLAIERRNNTNTVTKANIPLENDPVGFLSGKHILVIDNDLQVLEAMRQLITNWGGKATCVTDETKALDSGINAPDLILADFHLDHGHTGVRAVDKLFKAWAQSVPTILNSANYNEDIRQQAIDQGFAFLNKPLKAGTLKRAMKKAMGT
jgi:Na+/proline symporter/signal transduction histidine kinase